MAFSLVLFCRGEELEIVRMSARFSSRKRVLKNMSSTQKKTNCIASMICVFMDPHAIPRKERGIIFLETAKNSRKKNSKHIVVYPLWISRVYPTISRHTYCAHKDGRTDGSPISLKSHFPEEAITRHPPAKVVFIAQ